MLVVIVFFFKLCYSTHTINHLNYILFLSDRILLLLELCPRLQTKRPLFQLKYRSRTKGCATHESRRAVGWWQDGHFNFIPVQVVTVCSPLTGVQSHSLSWLTRFKRIHIKEVKKRWPLNLLSSENAACSLCKQRFYRVGVILKFALKSYRRGR